MLCNAGHCVDIVTIHVHVPALQVHVYVCTAGIIITTCGGGFQNHPRNLAFPSVVKIRLADCGVGERGRG